MFLGYFDPLKVQLKFMPRPLTLWLCSDIFLPLNQNECLVPHLQDPIHICLEPEAQGRGTTLKGQDKSKSLPKM